MQRLLFISLALAALIPASAFSARTAAAAEHPSIQTRAYSTPQLLFALRTDTQTLARLTPVLDPSFDFTPGPREAERQYDGYRHLGDLAVKLRVGQGAWRDYSTFAARQPVRVLAAGRALAAANLGPTMGDGLPLTVERRWLNERGTLVLRFTLINRGKQPVEVAQAALPMVFEQTAADPDAAASNTTVQPHPGERGYLEVARQNGQSPALRVQADGNTVLDGWQPAAKQPAGEQYASWVTQGFTLKPGAKRDIGVRFVIRPHGASR